MKKILGFLSLGFLLSQLSGQEAPLYPYTVQSSEENPELDRVLELMQKHLSLTHEVARWKWNHKLPISVDERSERALIGHYIARAKESGVSPEWMEIFIRSQLDAARILQYYDHEKWSKEGYGPFEEVFNYEEEISPYIANVMSELFDTLVKVYPKLTEKERCCLVLQRPLHESGENFIALEAWNLAAQPLNRIYQFCGK